MATDFNVLTITNVFFSRTTATLIRLVQIQMALFSALVILVSAEMAWHVLMQMPVFPLHARQMQAVLTTRPRRQILHLVVSAHAMSVTPATELPSAPMLKNVRRIFITAIRGLCVKILQGLLFAPAKLALLEMAIFVQKWTSAHLVLITVLLRSVAAALLHATIRGARLPVTVT